MNNDIQFEKNNIVFNYRVAIVIKNGQKILVQKDDRASHYTLPGGRCELGENSISTGMREFKEETGIDITLKKKVGMIENFFVSSFNGKNYQEILMIHEYKFNDYNLYNKSSITNIEEKKKEHLTYIWLSIDELKKANFKPEVILDMIKKEEFQHYIFD